MSEFLDQFSYEKLSEVFDAKLSDVKFRGADGVSADSFRQVLQLESQIIRRKIADRTYRFTRFREKLIPKGATSLPRIISVPTIRDALVLRVTCTFIHSNCPGAVQAPPHSFVKAIFSSAKAAKPDTSFVRLDVRDFYPSIVHAKLMSKLAAKIPDEHLLSVVESAIKTGTGAAAVNHLGVPQGLSISNALSNVYFLDEEEIFAGTDEWYRYVDDILIFSQASAAKEVLNSVSKNLQLSLGLTAHEYSATGEGKTTITSIDKGVEYLGFLISRAQISVRRKSYKKIFEAVSRVFYRHRNRARVERLIWKLNLKVTGCVFEGRSVGWMFFFRQTEDMQQLHRLDNYVRRRLRDAGLSAYSSRIKSFVKTYREIRYNREDTKYVPNFDSFTLADMTKTISILTGEDEASIAKRSREVIERDYYRLVSREASQLERESVDFAAS